MRRVLDRALAWGVRRSAAVGAAVLLLLLGVVVAAMNERGYNIQKTRENGVQAQIVSASVAPALMFDNNANAQEYLNALGENPTITAAGVYDASGQRVATFNRKDQHPPPESAPTAALGDRTRSIEVVVPVIRDGEALGFVYLSTEADPPLRRFSRYAGVAILCLLAALVLTVLGLAQGALSDANAKLMERAAELQREIEQRQRAEEDLLQSRKLEAIGQLTGGIAHDFNNLLMVVMSGLRLIEKGPTPERREAVLEAMRQAVERGAALTRQLLAFSRRQTLKLEAIDVSARLNGMRELLERSLRADIIVDIVCPPDLWAVKTDPTQFELAILNLAVNARDAMPRGGVLTIAVENRIEGNEEFVEVLVRDTGLGIPADLLGRVFEPYFTTKQAGRGTGLGLSQVYGIVKQSGGETFVESVVNEGTTVKLRFPRSQEAPREADATRTEAAPARDRGKAVLVVEDDDGVATVVVEMLRGMGYAPTRVPSAQEALRCFEEEPRYDIVFSDVVMPGEMNGLDLARELRRRRPDLPIVLTSGYSGAAQVGDEFVLLRKPYQPEELQHVLGAAMQKAA